MKQAVIVGLGDILGGDEGIGSFVLDTLAIEALGDSVQLTYLGDDPRWAGGLIYGADMAIIVGSLRIGGRPGSLHIWSYEVFRMHMAWLNNAFQTIRFLSQALARVELAGGFPNKLLFVWIEPDTKNGFGISKRIKRAVWEVRQVIKKKLFENGLLSQEALAVSHILHFEPFGIGNETRNSLQ